MKTSSLTYLTLIALGLGASACSSSDAGTTTTVTDAGVSTDAARTDAGPNKDASVTTDAATATDAATDSDAGASADATTADAATDASATTDAAVPDAATDAGTGADATLLDAGSDASVVDAAPPPPPGATCSNAPALAPPVSATYTMDATYGNDFTSGTGCFFKSGADRVFAVDVPAGKRLYSSVRGVGAFDPSIAIVDGAATCSASASTCLDANDQGLATSLNFVTTTNATATSKRYFVVVDGTDATGQYDFRAVVGDPLVGDTCATAPSITLTNGGASLASQTVNLYANDYGSGSGCAGFAGGERVYRLAVPANTSVAITATPEATFDASLNVIEGSVGPTPETACTTTPTCAAGTNAGGAGAAERLIYRNTGAAAKTIFVTVDAAVSTTTPGAFSLEVETLPQVPGDTCADPPVVSFTNGSATLTNQSLVYALNDYDLGTNCAGTAGPERGYAVTIPAGKILTVVASATALADGGASGLNPSINVVDAAACGAAARVCLRGADTSGASERLAFPNNGTAAQNVVVFVETAATAVLPPGTFDVTFTLTDPPPGETCATAPLVAPGSLANQSLLDFQNDYGSGTSCSGTSGPDRLYRVRVPDGQRLTATVTPDSTWDAAINLMNAAAGCVNTGRVCLAGRDSGGSGTAETVTWTNGSGAEVEVYIAVETYTSAAPAAGSPRSFTLDVAVATPPPAPTGDVCGTAPVVTAGTLRGQDLLGYANDYGSGTSCAPSFGTAGADRTYKVTVPAGQRLTATVTPSAVDGGSNWDPVLNLQQAAGCVSPGRVCLAGADSGASGTAETARWVNSGTAPADVYIVVESYGSADPTATSPRAFELTVAFDTIAALPVGDTCTDSQTAITTTTTLATESIENFTRNYSLSTCDSTGYASDGPDRTYRVTVGPGKTLTVTITPSANLDPSLAIVVGAASACTATLTCNGYSDTGLEGDSETASYTNSGTSAVNAFVVVGSWTVSFGTPTYDYGITFTLSP